MSRAKCQKEGFVPAGSPCISGFIGCSPRVGLILSLPFSFLKWKFLPMPILVKPASGCLFLEMVSEEASLGWEAPSRHL